MAKIQVPADLMMEVARRIRVGKDQLKYILEQNFSRTTALLNEFEGETARRFRSLHEENAKALSLVPVNLQRAADELETIVNRFVDADSGIVHIPDLVGTKSIHDYAGDFFKPDFSTIGPAHTSLTQLNERSDATSISAERPPREEPEKGFGDHVHDFFEGAWKPLSTLDDNIVKLGEQIEKDPVGTIGGMARDAIAAPVEGVVSGATFGWNFLWGTGDAREQAKEYVETEKQKFEEQGAAFYAGTAASAMAVQFLGKRIGIKGKLGDGGKYTLGGEDQDRLRGKISEGTSSVAKIGDSFGKAGTLVENPGTKIEWSKVSTHGIERMNERGVTKEMAEFWVENGKALSQNNGSKHLFFSEEGAAVVANDGTLVTVIPKSKYDDAYKALSRSLFGR
ncbi:WXG100 family type VII secretion target [Paenibacillus sp. P96]|uniref:WXG100 family type VII secretion target n=1 Tax=Paenibacillus zeirhizosphaerae TaxID=2987519 RepID=A0ABT9FSK5_9BACL|nr:WXG100 family type VII secretion target [Paenibacillus sp. P96]MDP4097660.1 WXG100 family type VII secretion target [Paenibacillus sp. P96]